MNTVVKDKAEGEIAQILRLLLNESGIKEAELARQVNLPQTTINRLLLGGTSDPRTYTLKPIADFFGLTIGQLCGFEPLPALRIKGSFNLTQKTPWQFIPLIEWQQIKSWVFERQKINPLIHKKWIGTERSISENSFALQSLVSLEPRFRRDSILIVDPGADYKDGHFIIIGLDGISPTVRRVIVDGGLILLKSMEQTSKVIQLDKKRHTIFGTIVESRVDTYHD